jgi:hypothetical protein
MKLTIPAWLIRTLKYGVMCGLSGLFLLIFGIAGFALVFAIYYQETDLQTVVSPDNQRSVVVTRLDYGHICGDGIKVSVKFQNGFLRSVFRNKNMCEANIKWLNTNEFSIENISNSDPKPQPLTIDVSKLKPYYD